MRRSLLFLMLAGVAALVAALVVYSALKKREQEVQQAMVQSVNIVVAAHDLHIGAKLDPASVKLARWSRDSMPPGAFTDVAAVLGKYVRTSFVQNEPIVANRLFSGVKTAGVLPLLVPPGMRAMSVPVDEVSDIAGFVLPGAHVDILVALQDPSTGGQPFSKIVLQNVEVLAVAQEIEGKKDEPKVVKVVTVLVTPEEAERLALASREGTLRLALRNYSDKKVVMTNGSTVAAMLRGGEPPAPVVEHQAVAHVAVHRKPKAVKVEILRNGSSSQSISFVHHGGRARNTSTLRGKEVGKADPAFDIAGVRNLTPAAPHSAAPLGSVAASARVSSIHGTRVARSSAAGEAGFSSDPHGAPNPFVAGPNSKTIDVP